MTVIVAARDDDDDGWVLASDSIAVDGDEPCGFVKLRSVDSPAGPVVYGAAGDAGLLETMAVCMRPVKGDPARWAQKFAVRATDLARERLQLNGDGNLDGVGLFAFGDSCWQLDSYLACPVLEKFIAVGSGGRVATGALSVLLNPGRCAEGVEWAVRYAMRVAIEHTTSCGGEVQLLRT